jgi:hypothetical protein
LNGIRWHPIAELSKHTAVPGADSKPLFPYRFAAYDLQSHAARFAIIATACIRMTPFEPHLWHLPCASRGAIRQQSKHSKSLLGELEVLRFQDGHETIDLARRKNEFLQFSISYSDESNVLLPTLICSVLCALLNPGLKGLML